ncbi:spore maturation protein CgeB [Bacillus ectoiniformans]|uniref:glycosyltransferase family protein n=1 Tax=Bacillus ectoiniformans TaxID=1494429 RepID=UPI0019587012|nr:glycosyltransferase [Bacillus ectoiniformans]MBM7647425.1 spore maturation protein CgeB [Bacillus ectoiniformans]
MRIIFLESSQIWCNNLPVGFQEDGHEVMISGPINKVNLEKMFAEFQPDVAVSIGWGLEQTTEKQLLIHEQVKKSNVPLVYWAVEDPAYTDVWSIPLIERMKPDFVFTLCPKTVRRYKELGIPAARLDFGFEPSLHCPVQPIARYCANIAVVANAYPDILDKYPDHYRHQAIQTLIRPLLERNIRVDFWGKNWDKMGDYFGKEIPSHWIHGHMPYPEANKVYSSANIMIGLQNYPDLLTQRTFEILGSGGFLLTLDTPGVRSMFKPGKDVAVSASPEETVQLVEDFLAHPHKRHAIQKKGRKSVQHHTYRARAKQMVDILIDSDILSIESDRRRKNGTLIYFEQEKEDDYLFYTIKKGDTLYSIAKSFGVTVASIQSLNQMTSEMIYEEQRIKVKDLRNEG